MGPERSVGHKPAPMLRDLIVTAAAIPFGISIGALLSFMVCAWTLALMHAFSNKVDGALTGRSQKRPPDRGDFFRLIRRLPLVACIHPLPWVLGLIVYYSYILIMGNLNSNQRLFGWSILVGFLGSSSYLFWYITRKPDTVPPNNSVDR
jgi:hypothetical protein